MIALFHPHPDATPAQWHVVKRAKQVGRFLPIEFGASHQDEFSPAFPKCRNELLPKPGGVGQAEEVAVSDPLERASDLSEQLVMGSAIELLRGDPVEKRRIIDSQRTAKGGAKNEVAVGLVKPAVFVTDILITQNSGFAVIKPGKRKGMTAADLREHLVKVRHKILSETGD